jgi:hypothetical protein
VFNPGILLKYTVLFLLLGSKVTNVYITTRKRNDREESGLIILVNLLVDLVAPLGAGDTLSMQIIGEVESESKRVRSRCAYSRGTRTLGQVSPMV